MHCECGSAEWLCAKLGGLDAQAGNALCVGSRAEESDAVVALVTQHKRGYEELQKALREAKLEVLPSALRSSLCCAHTSQHMHARLHGPPAPVQSS
jgi:hypothetical protein